MIIHYITPHAFLRMQKRGIYLADINFAILYGDVEYSKGSIVYILRNMQRACEPFPIRLIALIQRKHPLYVVVSKRGVVITASWRYSEGRKKAS